MRVVYFGSYSEIYPRNRILIDGLRENGVQVIEIQDRSPFGLKFLKLILKHWRYRHQYDFMIVGFPGFTSMPLAKMLATAPIIFDAFLSMYDSNVFDRKICTPRSLRGRYYFYLDKISCKLADIVLLDSLQHIDFFVKTYNLPHKKFHRIFIGAHDQVFFPAPPSHLPDSKFHILFWGWIIPLHGVEYILQAAKILENDQIDFLFIGGGADKKEMLKYKDKLELSRVKFLPAIPAQDLGKYIQEANLCLGIFGSTEKTGRVIPNKVYEALACKKALLTGDTLAAREILVDGKHCLFAKVADPADIAEKILTLQADEALRNKIAEGGYQLYLERFNPRVLGRELISILNLHESKA